MKSHPQHLADLLDLAREDLKLVESDAESGRRRYLAGDGNTYDVEPFQQRRGEDRELVTELRVAVVLPVDDQAAGLDSGGVCPTCGRARARATRRFAVADGEHLQQLLKEHGA